MSNQQPNPRITQPALEANFARTVQRYQTAFDAHNANLAGIIHPNLHSANTFFITSTTPSHTTQCPLCANTLPTHDALLAHIAVAHPNAYSLARPAPPPPLPHLPFQPIPPILPPWLGLPGIPPLPSAAGISAAAVPPPRPVAKNPALFCAICDVQCETVAQQTSHVEGQKHRRRAEIHEAFSVVTASFPREGITQISPSVWACIPCRICLDGKTQVMQHLEAVKHRRNREAVNRQAVPPASMSAPFVPPPQQQQPSRKRSRLVGAVRPTCPTGVPMPLGRDVDVQSVNEAKKPAIVQAGNAVGETAAQIVAEAAKSADVPTVAVEKPSVSEDDVFATVPLKKPAVQHAPGKQETDVGLTEVKLKEVELKDLLPPDVEIGNDGKGNGASGAGEKNGSSAAVMSVLQAAASLPKTGLRSKPYSVWPTPLDAEHKRTNASVSPQKKNAGGKNRPGVGASNPGNTAASTCMPLPTPAASAPASTTSALASAASTPLPAAQAPASAPAQAIATALPTTSIPAQRPTPASLLSAPLPPASAVAVQHAGPWSPLNGAVLQVAPPGSASGKFQCQICNVNCNSTDNYTAHLGSAKHKRKMMACTQSSNSSVSVPAASAPPPAESNNLFCKVCNIYCCGPDNFQAHLRGKPHAKRLRSSAAVAPTASQGG